MGFLSSLIPGFLKEAFGMVGDHFKAKRALKKAEVDSRLKVTEAKTNHIIRTAETQQDADIEWDLAWAKQAENSWKDEWFVILFSIPAVLCFIPGMDVYITRGFGALAAAPDWYFYCFITAVSASFGVKKLMEFVRR